MAAKTKKASKPSKPRKKSLFSFRGDPTKALTKGYILALSLIAIMTLIGHTLTVHVTQQQKESAEIAYHIGRQRTLVQQIILYASNYASVGQELDYNFLVQSVNELESSHKYVSSSIATGTTKSAALSSVYFKPPFMLDQRIQTFSSLVKDFAAIKPDDKRASRIERRKELLEDINHQATNALRPAMDVALEYYQTETLENIANYYYLQLSAAFVIIIVLLAEAGLIFRPLIERVRNHNETLKRYALEDALTGLNNRRAFMNAAEVELKRSVRDKAAITVALMDLDHFKQINDNYGHEVGDRVLRHFANILRESLRAGDITGRIGGEEFAIVLPKIDFKGAQHILERLCDTVAETPCEYEDAEGNVQNLNYTVSIGFVGPSLVNGQSIDNLLNQADSGLYEAKEQGRNCVISVSHSRNAA